MGFDAGLVICASHNPFEDNGIKVFSGRGEKFTEALERQVEAIIADPSWQRARPAACRRSSAPMSIDAYIAHARLALPDPRTARPLQARDRHRERRDDDGGAAAVPRAGLRRHRDRRSPDGRNINLDCGSTHPEKPAARGRRAGRPSHGRGVRRRRRSRDLRRCTRAASSTATPCMLMCARHMKSQGRLNGNAIVATVMSNIGLEIALRERGIELVRCPVGDKYVMEEMIKRGISHRRRAVRATSSSRTISSPATASSPR